MNYRELLKEMLIDYVDRRSETRSAEKYSAYTEIIKDIRIALDIEPNQISIINEAKDILKEERPPSSNTMMNYP